MVVAVPQPWLLKTFSNSKSLTYLNRAPAKPGVFYWHNFPNYPACIKAALRYEEFVEFPDHADWVDLVGYSSILTK